MFLQKIFVKIIEKLLALKITQGTLFTPEKPTPKISFYPLLKYLILKKEY